MYSEPIYRLIKALQKFPGVGQRTAERFVFYLLKSGKKDVIELVNALNSLAQKIKSCEICWDFSESNPCEICQNKTRNKSVICVVSESQYLKTIKQNTKFNGLFHILRGTINSEIDNLNDLKILQLLERIKKENITEIILALNPDLEGETTILFLSQKIKKINPDIKITRLARGLPMGSDLLYADEITLISALENRTDSIK